MKQRGILFEAIAARIAGVKIICPDVFKDARGFFKEIYVTEKFKGIGIYDEFKQDNISRSRRGVLRGMHSDPQMTKLVQCVAGSIYDVVLDLREDSSTYAKWQGFWLDEHGHEMIYIPAGCAHGFLTLSNSATVSYKQTSLHNPDTEVVTAWDNPTYQIKWPLQEYGINAPILSEKDAAASREAFLISRELGDVP